MRSIKPGRGPSGMNFIGSIVVVVFGIFWTIIAATITSGAGIFGIIFPLFGVLFVGLGIAQAVYHYKNTTGKDRFSVYDITESGEEDDPGNRWVSQDDDRPADPKKGFAYCPYCGQELESDHKYCSGCGRPIE